MERLRDSEKLPAGLAWSNSLASIDEVAILARAREGFRKLLEERPGDPELEARIRGYIDEARAELSAREGAEELLDSLGTADELFGPGIAQ